MDNVIEEAFNKLGLKAKDLVTGSKGVITGTCFDLYGCIQVVLLPEADKDGKMQDGHWIDLSRVETTSKERVMPLPQFIHKALAGDDEQVKEVINKMGKRAEDKVTGVKGIISSVSFSLYGVIQVVLTPKAEKGKVPDSFFLDANRINILSEKERVMPLPPFLQRTLEKIKEEVTGPVDMSRTRRI